MFCCSCFNFGQEENEEKRSPMKHPIHIIQLEPNNFKSASKDVKTRDQGTMTTFHDVSMTPAAGSSTSPDTTASFVLTDRSNFDEDLKNNNRKMPFIFPTISRFITKPHIDYHHLNVTLFNATSIFRPEPRASPAPTSTFYQN